MIQLRFIAIILPLVWCAGPGFAAAAGIVTVSPGEEEGIVPVASSCPTFSWAASEPGAGFEIAVHALREDGALDSEPTLRHRLPAGVSSWTPPGNRCLAPGRYAWTMHALAGDGAAAGPRLFEVAKQGSPELEAAIEQMVERALRRLLAEVDATSARAAIAEPAQTPTEAERSTRTVRGAEQSPSFVADASNFNFPACTEVPALFADVPNSHPLCPFIKQFYSDQITAGCAADPDLRFCPDEAVTRSQLAVYLERAMRGTATWDVRADLLDGLDSSAFLRVSGGSMTGDIDMQNNLILNIGDAGTDFTAGGGLNLANQLQVSGSTTLGDTPTVDTVTINAALLANGNVTLGDTASDTVTINAGPTTLPNATTAAEGLVLGGDANLYRSASNVLQTDDSFFVAGNTTLGTALSDTLTVASTLLGATPLVFEGLTSDGLESTIAIADPTADRTITLPNASGEVSLLGQTISASEITNLSRTVSLPIPAFLNCSDNEAIGFSSGDDDDPDFATSRLYIEWDVDATPDNDYVCTSFVVPPDISGTGGILRLSSEVGAAHNNDWGIDCDRCRAGNSGCLACAASGGSNCDSTGAAGEIYSCDITLAGLLSGDAIELFIQRAGGSDPMRLYSVEFTYTATQ